MYLDIDIHHGDGVEEAFFTSPIEFLLFHSTNTAISSRAREISTILASTTALVTLLMFLSTMA